MYNLSQQKQRVATTIGNAIKGRKYDEELLEPAVGKTG
jgi:hypothetical protein